MTNFNKLADLASMVYLASLIKEAATDNIKDEYIYTYPSSENEKVIVNCNKVKYCHLDWSISFFHVKSTITILDSSFSDFKRVKKVLRYTLKVLLEDRAAEYLNTWNNV